MGDIGAYFGSKEQAKGVKKAGKYQLQAALAAIQAQKDAEARARTAFAPYAELGERAIPGLEGADPTGGASRYMAQLEALGGGSAKPGGLVGGLPPGERFAAGGGPGGDVSRFAATAAPSAGTAVGSPGFQYNPNDPAYQFKKEQIEKSINQSLASRGLYNSRMGVNALSEANARLIAEETDKQYARKYGQLTDLFQMSTTLGGSQYGKQLDLTNIGMGAASLTGQTAAATGQGISQTYGNLGQNLAAGAMAGAQVQSDIYSGIGNIPLNYLMMKDLYGGGKTTPTTTATTTTRGSGNYGTYR